MREKRFWNLFANKYSKNKIGNVKGYEDTLKIVGKYLKKNQKVLEIGCGTGTTALKLASKVKEYDATDISENMVKIGRGKAKEQKIKNVNFFDCDVFDKRLKKNSYDVIMAHNLVHLVKNRDDLMLRVNGLLKPGGLFISKTPCLGESKLMYVVAFFVTPLIGPVRCFSVDEYRKSLDDSGFKIVKEKVYKKEDPPRILAVAKKV